MAGFCVDYIWWQRTDKRGNWRAFDRLGILGSVARCWSTPDEVVRDGLQVSCIHLAEADATGFSRINQRCNHRTIKKPHEIRSLIPMCLQLYQILLSVYYHQVCDKNNSFTCDNLVHRNVNWAETMSDKILRCGQEIGDVKDTKVEPVTCDCLGAD